MRSSRNRSGVWFQTRPERVHRITSFTTTLALTVMVRVILPSVHCITLHLAEQIHSRPFISVYGLLLNGFRLLADYRNEVGHLGSKSVHFLFDGVSMGVRELKHAFRSI